MPIACVSRRVPLAHSYLVDKRPSVVNCESGCTWPVGGRGRYLRRYRTSPQTCIVAVPGRLFVARRRLPARCIVRATAACTALRCCGNELPQPCLAPLLIYHSSTLKCHIIYYFCLPPYACECVLPKFPRKTPCYGK